MITRMTFTDWLRFFGTCAHEWYPTDFGGPDLCRNCNAWNI